MQNGFARAVASGWQINMLTSIMSGTPFSVTSGNAPLRMPNNDQRADQVNGDVKKLGGIGVGQPHYDWTAVRNDPSGVRLEVDIAARIVEGAGSTQAVETGCTETSVGNASVFSED